MNQPKRFFFANHNLKSLSKQLESKGFNQLPDAGDELDKIVIDKERKHFWLVDYPCFQQNAKTISIYHKQDVHILETEDLKGL